MTDDSRSVPPPTIPPDDPVRRLTIARPDQDQSLPHVGLVGDTYTILVGGDDTNGQYTLIDMHVPSGGGPPPHRHDFEEMFTVLDGEIEVTFRGEIITAQAGETINVPANAPHAFRNAGQGPSRLLCLVCPGRPGRVLHPRRPTRRYPNHAAPAARRHGPGGLHRQGAIAGPPIPH